VSTSTASAAALLLASALWLACSEAGEGTKPETGAAGPAIDGWDAGQLQLLRSLSLASLPAAPADPTNRVADDERAARLGQRLFFDPSLSGNGAVSCATCHRPELHFTDGQPTSMGLGPGARNAPSVVGASHSPWLFWDGRRDSLWSQALAPIEVTTEMGGTRLEVARLVSRDPRYRADYEALFGPAPSFDDPVLFPARASPYGDPESRAAWDRLPEEARHQVNLAFANAGKAIAAYERRLAPGPARFDRYVERLVEGDLDGARRTLQPDEIAGLRLFLDGARTQCLRCHNGPLFTNQSFHDVASSRFGPMPDLGRFVGIQSLLLDPFNCLGPYSDAAEEHCDELRFLERREMARLSGAFKTPTLREVERTAPYFHDGRLATLEEVIEHYRRPPADPGSELVPLELTDGEAAQMVAFLRALSGGVAAAADWLEPPPDLAR
jgi:cytochrome c peroxidase